MADRSYPAYCCDALLGFHLHGCLVSSSGHTVRGVIERG